MTRLHASVYGRSNGRMLGRMGGAPVLLLETTGRRRQVAEDPGPVSRRRRDVRRRRVERRSARPPAWCLNLREHQRARVQVGARTVDVSAHEVTGEERTALWRRLTAVNRYLEGAARKAGHELPLLALTPSGPGSPTRGESLP